MFRTGFNPIICNVSGYGEQKHFCLSPIVCNVSGYGENKNILALNVDGNEK
jgi:hypothetical protein